MGERTVAPATDATKTPPASRASMDPPATPFFRDVRMPSAMNAAHDRERFLLDTLAERRAEEKPRGREWVRGIVARGGAFLRLS